MIHHRTKQEVRRYDIFKGIITVLLLLLLFFLVNQAPAEMADVTPPDEEIAEVALTAPQLLSPAPGTAVEPGLVEFSGMGVPLSTAALLVDGTQAAQTAVLEDGSWQMSAELAAGPRSIELQTLDAGGNIAAAAPAFTLNVNTMDAEMPLVDAGDVDVTLPALSLPAAGLAAGIGALSGTGEPGYDMGVSVDGQELARTTVDPDGTWSLDVPLEPGRRALTLQLYTADGIPAGSATEIEVDVAEPVLPTVDLPVEDVAGGEFTLSGTGAPGARILLYAGSVALGEAVVNEDGTWQLPVTLESGDYEIDVAAIGADGAETERMPAISLPVLPATDEAAVTGTVTYVQRIALPPDAVITVQLQDVSRAGAPAEIIGEQVIPADGAQVPFEFAVPYNPADIVEGNTYALRATINDADGNLLFTSDTVIPVITGDNPTENVEIVTVQVPATADGEVAVSGTVTYLQRSALSPTDTVTVQVQDTSLADAPATVIGEQVITVGDQQVPIDYSVAYDPAEIVDNHTYTMSARIEDADGNLLFINDTVIPVITRGNPTTDVEIMTVPVDSAATDSSAATVSGTVTYPQRIALPPDAVLEVSLQDISTPGAAAQELGKVTIPTASRQVPIPFEISYDPAEIVDNHTYAVRARILDGNGDLIWTSDSVTPVITNGNPTEDVEIVVVPVQTAVAPDVEFDPNAETAVEAADGAETFNTLLNGLEAAGLAEMLSDPEATFTLFAPTDAAFDALPPEVVAAWNANPARYAEMMSYLVVEGAYAPEDLRDGQVLRSIAGTNIAINKEGEKVFVNGEPTANSVVAGNSVVYALNRVILAPLRPGVVPPLIDEKGVPVFKGPLLTVVGVAQSGKRILLQVDGENFGDIATVDDNDFWLVKQNIDSGVHQILAYMLEDDDTLMAISQLVILPVP
jgi:uncharacterized lipoprotein YbaY